ncbi:MAG: AsmA family protein [Kiloniellaceae bacterium]
MRRAAKILAWLLGGLAGLIALAAIVLAFFDWNTLRSTVNERASAASGRDVRIAGSLDVDLWSWTPEVTAQDVTFANADWAAEEDMVRIDRVYLKIRLLPIFAGRLEVEELRLDKPQIRLQRRDDDANWDIAGDTASEVAVDIAAPTEREDFPVLKQVTVTDATIHFQDSAMQDPIEVTLSRLRIDAGGFDAPVDLSAEGHYQGQDFSLEAHGASFARLREGGVPYDLTLEARIGATHFTAEGVLDEPVKLAGIDARVALEGDTLVELFDLLALPLPESPPYALKGQLKREGARWALTGFEGRLGESDLDGDIAVETDRERPLITADLRSQSFRVEDIDGFWAGEDDGGEAEETKAADSGHILPDEPFSLPKLRRMDAKLSFEGQAVRSGALELQDIATELTLEDGVLTMTPLELGLAEGRIAADLRLDGRGEVPEMAGDVRIEGLDINALMVLLGEENAASGLLQGRLQLAMRGRSLRELGAGANGEGALVMSGGTIENLLLELIALDLQEAAGQWLTGDNSQVDVLCLAMPTKIESGRFQAMPWILDTSDALVTIDGYVDLESEQINIELEPHPKDFSLFNYLTSIEITGNLATREVTTNPLEAAGKVALKALAAPLMPLFSGEIEEDAEAQSVPCDSLRQSLETAMDQGDLDVEQAKEAAQEDEEQGSAEPANGAAEVASQDETAQAQPLDAATVRRVQSALVDEGFDIQVDGIMGPATAGALADFQRREDLQSDGRPTADTLRRLGVEEPQRE